MGERGLALFHRGFWDEAGDQFLRGFFHHAGRAAIGQFLNGAGGGGGGGGSDAGQFQSEAVGDAIVAGGVFQPDRVVGGDGIKLGGGRVAAVFEFAFVPADAQHPLALGGGGDAGFHGGDHVFHRTRAAERDLVEFAETSGEDMGVGIDQAGRRGAAFQIDHLGFRADQGADAGIAAHRGDLAAADGQRLDHAVLRIGSNDAAVEEDGIGGCRQCGCCQQRRCCHQVPDHRSPPARLMRIVWRSLDGRQAFSVRLRYSAAKSLSDRRPDHRPSAGRWGFPRERSRRLTGRRGA